MSADNSKLKAIASQIKLIAFDVDGVLTTGEITYTANGDEIKSFNCKDGQGINMLNSVGIKTAIITARTSSIIERRAKDLNIGDVYQGSKNKLTAITEIAAKHNLELSEIAFVGDDLPDMPVLINVGLACCPADAVDEVKNVCEFICLKKGGEGAVREVTDFVIYSNPQALETCQQIFKLSFVN